MSTSFLAIIISALLVNYVYSQQQITCYMCQVGLQQISTSLQGNPDAMNTLALEFVESCDTVPSESQALACKHLFEPE
uniref:Saposin B-type domain-containing protein n=1 Tax=Acrobeloides nanus TaxID=290746 RepID=A0A914BXF3_9BILA